MNPFLRDVVIAVVAVGAVILCQTIVGKQKVEKNKRKRRHLTADIQETNLRFERKKI